MPRSSPEGNGAAGVRAGWRSRRPAVAFGVHRAHRTAPGAAVSLVRRLLLLTLPVWAPLSAAGPTPAVAQDRPLLLEAHGGWVLPIGSFADGTDPGEGVSGGPAARVLFALPSGRRTLYLGFHQNRFGCEDAGCAAEGRLVATGFNAGVRIALLQGRLVMPWLGVGAITTRVETEDLPAPNAGVSDLGWGGEAGAGLYIGGDRSFAVNPAVTVAAVGSDLPGGSSLKLRYVTVHLGLVVAF